MAKANVTIDGVTYPSRIAAAKALVAVGKSISEAAKLTGITYQTVYVNTKGAEKGAVRRTKYRILSLGKSNSSTVGEIAKKTGVSASKIVALLKTAGIPILSKEEKAKREAEAKAAKESTKVKKPVKTKKTKKEKVAVSTPATPEANVVPTPTTPLLPEDMIQDNFESDDAAAAEAIKDMASE